MSDSTVILNARLPYRAGLYQIVIEEAWVTAIEAVDEDIATLPEARLPEAMMIDVAGDWVTLGAVDLQINGALGLAFPDVRHSDFEQLQAICELLWQQGVDAFCPTLVTTSIENFQGSLAAISEFQQQQNDQRNNKSAQSAKILGIHLEGPFLNKAKLGAHPLEYLQSLTFENVKATINNFAQTVRIITLAPEIAVGLEGEKIIRWLCDRNITVSLGHSLATAKQANQAFDQGASMVTHAFNAMPSLHHREPGLLGAALTHPHVFLRVYCRWRAYLPHHARFVGSHWPRQSACCDGRIVFGERCAFAAGFARWQLCLGQPRN